MVLQQTKPKKNDLKYYNINANKWWQEGEVLNLSNHLNQSRFQFFANFVPDWRGLQVLDMGCGGGLACEFLAKQGAIATGIDVSPESIQVAQDHAHQQGLSIPYHCGVAEELPFPENCFDVVVCCDVLEHVNNYQKVIAETYRVLKPKGLFLFDTLNRTVKSKVIMIWLMEDILKRLPKGLHDWHKFIKPKALITTLQQSDFQEILIKGFDLTGGMSLETLKNVFLKGLTQTNSEQNSALFSIKINDDTSVWYIGKAMKF